MNQISKEYTYWMKAVFSWITVICSLFCLILGTVVLIGWYSHNTVLVQIHPTFVPMQYNTALGFILGGIGSICMQFNLKRANILFGSLVALVSSLTLLQYIFDIHLGIDELFMDHYIHTKTFHPGRMAPNTALCFFIISCCLLIQFFSPPKKAKIALGVLSLICVSLGLVALGGYITKVETALSWGSLTGMAIHTSIGFIVLGTGGFFYSWRISIDKSIFPKWFYISVGISASTITLLIWQALNTIYDRPELISSNTYIPFIILIVGMVASLLLVGLIYFIGQNQEARSQLELVNQKIIDSNKLLEEKVKERTKELTKSNVELNNMMKTMDESALVSTTDKHGDITYVNDKFCEISEYTREELIGQNHRILKSGKQPDSLFAALWKIISKGKAWNGEILNKKKGGGFYWVHTTIYPYKNINGEVDKYVSVRFDISSQKEQQEELRSMNCRLLNKKTRLANSIQKLHQFKQIVSESSDMVALIDNNYIYRVASNSYAQAFGLSQEELVSRSVSEVFGEEFFETTIKPNADRCLNGEKINYEDWFNFPGTGKKYMEINYLPHKEEVGNITGFIVNARDITERKKSREQLEKTNQELGHFAYVASHDLQEPLRVVTSYMELLEKRYTGELDEKSLKYINRAVEATNRMKSLINDLLLLTRLENKDENFEPVDINEIMEGVIKDMGVLIKDHNAKINYNHLPKVKGDKAQLRQLFQNLVNNGIKFNKEGENPQIEIIANKKETLVEFAIKDNGIGIDEKYFDRIFVIFQRLHGRQEYSGTGIGLAMCKKIVEQHDGNLWVESQPEKGSTFYFTLPLDKHLN